MVLRAVRVRVCALCGRDAERPARCPMCGAWVCQQHMADHVAAHYVRLPIR